MQISQSTKLAVIGAGSWGTVIAYLLATNGHSVILWARRESLAWEINATKENAHYVPGLKLPEKLLASSSLSKATEGVDAVVIAVPSHGLRSVLTELPDVPALISASKGLEGGSFKRFTEVMAEYQSATLAALSGPNLAAEIAVGKPTAATLASADEAFAKKAQSWFNSERLRVYRSSDVTGVELAGAMKNVVALAAGMADGLALGDNAKATIMTRGLVEIVRLGTHLGGDPESFYGLAGLGDMVATCAGAKSRNHRAGSRIAKGDTLTQLKADKLTAEGIPTVKAVYDYAAVNQLELPICTQVYNVIYEQKSPQIAIQDLMRRPYTVE